MHRPLLSINIVSYNTRDITIQCIRSIQKSIHFKWLTKSPEKDIEIIVLDNASHDGTIEALTSLQAEIQIPLSIIANTENIGFGKGHNKASKESRGELLLLLNTDTILIKDALESLVESYLKHNPSSILQFQNSIPHETSGFRIHFAGPKLLNQDMSPQPSCGPYYSLSTIFAALFLRGDHWGLTRYSPQNAKQVDWVSGACMLCKKEYFDELEGFDENIFMYMEEIELLRRASKKGMQVWCFPHAEVVHLGSASSDTTYPIFQVYRGFIYLYKKHHTALELHMVQWLLALKARLAIVLGTILKKPLLIRTYTKALQIVEDDNNSVTL